MKARVLLLVFIFTASYQAPYASSVSNECSHESEIFCNHFVELSSSDTMKIKGLIDFEVSGDGDHILYTTSDKYNLVELDDLSVVESDYLMPNQTIGIDGKTGLLTVYGNQDCFFPGENQICILNDTLLLDYTAENPVGYWGAYHSDEYIICDLTDGSFYSTYHCEGAMKLRQSSYSENSAKFFSPDGKYEIDFISLLVDEDMGADDYDGVISYGEVLSWEINHQNESYPKSVTRILGGYHLPSSTKDDVYSMLWSHDSKYAYVITCEDIFGVDVISNSVESLGSPPFDCETPWADDKVEYINLESKISMDGSTIVYRYGSEIGILYLEDEVGISSTVIFTGIISVLVVGIGIAYVYGGKK